jgi:D-apionolactonase
MPTTSNVLRYGKAEPLAQSIPLRAGPLALLYEGGDLRAIKYGDVEIVRRVYVAVRDRNWGTVLPRFSDVAVEPRADSFRITYTVENARDEIDFAWQAEITGSAGGTLAFRMDGAARSTFLKNRIGICVLLPASQAGRPCEITHVEGVTESAALPELIVPDQPVPPFADLGVLRYGVAPGVQAELRFAGDLFEMEDQRNWTDASYKIFSTPLRLPYPVEIQSGAKVVQSFHLSLQHDRPSTLVRASTQPQTATVVLTPHSFHLTPHTAPLPRIGLGMASHGRTLSAREVERLKVLRLSHLRVDLHLADGGYADVLRCAVAQSLALGVPLEMAVLVPAAGDAELRRLADLLAEARPRVARWLIYPERELFGGGSATGPAVRLAHRHLAAYDPAAPFAAGTNADFIFMQRTPPPLVLLDMACLALNPQVHAFDNASLMETLQAQAAVVHTARRLAGGKPVAVSAVTLKPRFNPYASGAIPATPAGQLPPQVDERQMALFGAGWTMGSLKYPAEAGAFSVTYYETSGWRGVMECEAGSPEPALFYSSPGAVFPLYHVLADVGEFAGGEIVTSRSSDPLQVDGLALRKDGRLRVLVANLTNDPQAVTVEWPASAAFVRMLDEINAEQAMQSPENYRHQPGEQVLARDGTLSLSLRPYALARIDVLPG